MQMTGMMVFQDLPFQPASRSQAPAGAFGDPGGIPIGYGTAVVMVGDTGAIMAGGNLILIATRQASPAK